MKHGQLLEHGTLNWVKKELDVVLEQARHALERYIERDNDKSCLAEVKEALHQVGGTLQMVELYGAAMLAQEMEDLAQALHDDMVRNAEDAVEVLLRAILQLPDYLEHIQAGNRDVPIVLLPLLNDLRTSREASLLSERVLFFPELENAPAPKNAVQPVGSESRQDTLRRLRHTLQLGLLAWFRDEHARDGLDKVFAVTDRLYRLSGDETARRLWWISSALAEALFLNGLESSVTVKSLMGKVDRELKHYIDDGEQAFAERIPEELFKNLLYYTACADDKGELIRAVKETYALNQLLPKESHLEEMRTHIAGPNLKLLNAVSTAMREDLAGVKDGLEIYCSGDHKDPGDLNDIAQKLGPIADTLGMLGLGSQREEVLSEAQSLKEIASGEVAAPDATILDIAGTMLHVETAIDSLVSGRSGVPEPDAPVEDDDTQVSEATMREVLDSVTVECLHDIKFIKETIDATAAGADDTGRFAEIPACLERMQGAMSVAGVESVLPLLQSLHGYMGTRTLPAGELPGGAELEHLADAVASLEYFFESFNTQAVPHRAILGVGEASLARLGFPAPREGAEVIQLGARAELPTVLEEITLEESQEPASNVYPLHEAIGATTEDGLHAAVLPADEHQVQPDPEDDEFVSVEVVLDEAEVEPAELVPLATGADEEILDIFLEEARDETEKISNRFQSWRDDGDYDSLVSIRRAFHTLKGSGRLVGAQLMGEFAWSIENMLNRILDKTIDADEHVFELMEQAIAALPELIAQTRGQGEPATSPLILMAAADALASQGQTDTAGMEATDAVDGLDEKEPATALNEEVTTEYARQLARSLGFLDDED
ncbi:MAG: Hpt domain-containing protein, partial [Gammaproteobacteria bacterium]